MRCGWLALAGGLAVVGCGGASGDEPLAAGSEADAGERDVAAADATVADDARADAVDAAADAPLDVSSDASDADSPDGAADAGADVAVEPPVDPCVHEHGDGWYCGASLPGSGADPDTLFHCVGDATASATACASGCLVKPPGVPDVCAPAAAARGKGVWVWMFGSSAPSAAEVAASCAQLGVGFVLIKSGEDDAAYRTNFSAANVAEFTSRGIEVYGWPYVRPGNLAAKIQAAVEQINVPGVTGLVIDAEGEFVAHDADAVALCDGIRAGAPGKFLGYTTFGWVAYHTDFPYQAFDAHCGDAFLPQTYWDEWTTGPVGGYQKAVDGAAQLGLTAPIWAIQDDYGGASAADMNAFFAAAGPRASVWRWPSPGDTQIAARLAQLDWANP